MSLTLLEKAKLELREARAAVHKKEEVRKEVQIYTECKQAIDLLKEYENTIEAMRNQTVEIERRKKDLLIKIPLLTEELLRERKESEIMKKIQEMDREDLRIILEENQPVDPSLDLSLEDVKYESAIIKSPVKEKKSSFYSVLHNTIEYTERKILVYVKPVPFNFGTERLAHVASYYNETEKMVIKLPRRRVLGIVPNEAEIHVRLYMIVSYLCEKFMERLRSTHSRKWDFKFTPVQIIQLVDRTPTIFGVTEEFLPSTKFSKFNSNAIGIYDKEAKEAQAFSHFSFDYSNQLYVVVDLQGSYTNETGYCLSDPAIHSPEKIFGMTDRGIEGIKDFLKMHICNDACKIMNLSKLENFSFEKK